MDFHVFPGDSTSHEHSRGSQSQTRTSDAAQTIEINRIQAVAQTMDICMSHGHHAVRPLIQTWSSVAAWAWTSHGLRW